MSKDSKDVKRWIGFDLDGTLARYDGWVDEKHIGEPVPEMIARVQKHLADGMECRILTARVAGERGSGENVISAAETRQLIEEWSLLHIGVVLPVTCEKDFGMVVLYDDRCVHVQKNTGQLCCDHVPDPPKWEKKVE